jgi:hypothetical protein
MCVIVCVCVYSKVQRDRGDLYDLLLRCSHELRDKRTFHTIIHKVDEENASRLRLHQLKSREKSLREVVVKLKTQLEDEQNSFKRIAGVYKCVGICVLWAVRRLMDGSV